MIIEFDPSGSVETFGKKLKALQSNSAVKSTLVFSCDNNNFIKEDVDGFLKESIKPVFGGIFPEIIHGDQKYTKGTVFAGIESETDVLTIDKLSDIAANYDDQLEEKVSDDKIHKTLFVFVDGFSKRISALIDAMFNYLGLDINYVGGGAGSLSFIQKPCLFTNNGLLEDAAILAFVDTDSGIGVSHGWEKISGPFKITECDRNVIKSLDWKPAFDVYKEEVEKQSAKKFTADNFFDIAKGFPFGILKLDAESIVRDPISVDEDGGLVCVGELFADSFVDILRGENNNLIEAARTAFQRSLTAFGESNNPVSAIFIDCISRVLFLEEHFSEEIKAVSENNVPVFGALSIGEIANSGRDFLEFYNKTAVVGVFKE